MSLIDDYLKYTDRFGLIQPEPNSTSGNGLLYSAEAIVAWFDNLYLTPEVRAMWQNVYRACEKEQGLMMRAPQGKDDQEGPDDYIGCGLASAFVDGGALAQRILDYGRQYCTEFDPHYEQEGTIKILKWEVDRKKFSAFVFKTMNFLNFGRGVRYVYNNEYPKKFTLSAWMGRFPMIIAHLKYACQERPRWFERLWWCLSFIDQPEKNNHDAWILDWCRARAWDKSGRKGVLEKFCVWLWRRRFTKVWGNPGDLLGAYHVNPNHPNAVWLRKSR